MKPEEKSLILVVDDDNIVRILLRHVLEDAGYEVVDSDDSRKTLQIVRKQAVDLILLDIDLPDQNGLVLCQEIQEELDDCPPILMIIGRDDTERIDELFAAGADDYIGKPFQYNVLRNKIRYFLTEYQHRKRQARLIRRYEKIINATANGICAVDRRERIVFVNTTALKILGYREEELWGGLYRQFFLLSESSTGRFDIDCCPYFQAEQVTSETVSFEDVFLKRKNGAAVPVDCHSTPTFENGSVSGGVIVFQDISGRKREEEEHRHQAQHDALTKLPNRNYFNERLPAAVALARRDKTMLACLFIDLDKFKPINDNHGHDVGDKVLQELARRISVTLRPTDMACRLGGDEFVVLLEKIKSVQGAVKVAKKIIQLLSTPLKINDITCQLGCSIGISIYPMDGDDPDTILRHGDVAMYAAKKKGGNSYKLYMHCKQRASIIPPWHKLGYHRRSSCIAELLPAKLKPSIR